MTDEQTIRYVEANKAALVGWLRKPMTIEAWSSDIARGMLSFRERVRAQAEQRGLDVLVASGIEREYCQNNLYDGMVDICGFFVLQAPKLKGEQSEHKYMVLTPARNEPRDPILIVGTPVSIHPFHKEIIKDLSDCIGQDVRQWGGGYYEGFCPKGTGSPISPRVYGKSDDFGEFVMPEAVAGMLAKLKSHADQNRDALEQQRKQTEKLLALTQDEINAEIIRRVEPWLAYIAGESDQVPLIYSCYSDLPFPDIKLFELGGYDKCFHVCNMNHVLALSSVYKVDWRNNLERDEITTRFVGDIPVETARLIERVAIDDMDAQAEQGQMIYIAQTVGNLRRLNLLTPAVEEYAGQKFPESLGRFYDEVEEHRGHRNIQFNATDSFAELSGTRIYDTMVEQVRQLINAERENRSLTHEETNWYQKYFVKAVEVNRKGD